MARKIPDREAGIHKLSEDSLRERLILAERALVLFGWCAVRDQSPREKLLNRAWHEWARYLGGDNLSPRANPNLDHSVNWVEASADSRMTNERNES